MDPKDESTTPEGEGATTPEPTIYDAVAEAVKEATPEPVKDEEVVKGDETDEGETDEGEGAEAVKDGESGDGTTGEEEEGDDDKGGKTGGDAGKDEGAAKEKKDEAGGEGEGGKKAEENDDPVNAPIPEGLKESTRERMTALVGKVKELAPAAQERDELLQAIEYTGATPEQYAQTLQFLALYNSDKPEHRKQALGVVKGMLHELAVELNEDVSLDPLASYPDLQAEVEEKTLTEERAREIARGRERDRINNERREHRTRTENQQDETRKAVANGKIALNTLEKQLRSRDGEMYNRKKAALIPVLKTIMGQVPPKLWAQTFMEAYNGMPAPAAPVNPNPTPPNNGKPPKNQPMRASGQPAGDRQKAPATAAEAAMAALRMT